MTFKEQMLDDFRLSILNTDEFAESVVYSVDATLDYLVDIDSNYIVDVDGYAIMVNQISQTYKTINALVIRDRLHVNPQGEGRALGREYEIYILNDATYGVTSVNKGQDKISLPILVGGDAVEFRVSDILNVDESVWHLLLQR